MQIAASDTVVVSFVTFELDLPAASPVIDSAEERGGDDSGERREEW